MEIKLYRLYINTLKVTKNIFFINIPDSKKRCLFSNLPDKKTSQLHSMNFMVGFPSSLVLTNRDGAPYCILSKSRIQVVQGDSTASNQSRNISAKSQHFRIFRIQENKKKMSIEAKFLTNHGREKQKNIIDNYTDRKRKKVCNVTQTKTTNIVIFQKHIFIFLFFLFCELN